MRKENHPDPDPGRLVIRDYRQGDEDEIVEILRSCHPQGWQDPEFWRWRHLNRPGFSSAEVLTALVEGKMVGCFHGAVQPVYLEPGFQVPCSYDGDFAVLKPHRGRDIPATVHDMTDRRLLERGVMLRGGFTSRALNKKFYNRQFGYVIIPTETRGYRKIIGLGPLKEKVSRLGDRLLGQPQYRKLVARRSFRINIEINGLPPCNIELATDGAKLHEETSDASQLWIRAEYRLIRSVSEGALSLARTAAFQMLTGKMRVRGLFRHMIPGIALARILKRSL